MNERRVSAVLLVHSCVTLVIGLALFLLPVASARLWPWPLPALAARFMGALLLGGAVCSFVCLRVRRPEALPVMFFVAIGDLLIAATGLMHLGDLGITPSSAGFLALFVGLAVLIATGLGHVAARGPRGTADPLGPWIRTFFFVHLLVVLPVGTAMFFAPAWAQPFWPWKMTPVNVQLIGSFFLGSALISLFCLPRRPAVTLLPVLALYATFAWLATGASLIHRHLFDPQRHLTWAFFALYVFVATGSSVLGWLLTRRSWS